MNIKEKDVYYNFLLEKKEFVKEINSYSYEFTHIKSGAKLLFIANDDKNKVFSISFRTPPEDDCGTAHIMEHSVLCGSKKYPLKEPFVELMKSSLNTFLNAMTFSDKTMYPVASLNEADFRNLVDVYLDAVFNPLIYTKEDILRQEGWHYHIENENDEIVYNGVVYNEMKGALSDPEDIMARNIEATLYKDTPYSYESGGDPKYIPDLTYSKFLNFHKKYYHPNNSYIYIYGDTDIMYHLEHIDKMYLENYDKLKVDSKINEQKDITTLDKKIVKGYSVDDEENINNKYLLSLNYSVGNVLDIELGLKFSILAKILFDSDSSYLKKALLDANIAGEVMLDYNGGILQPVFSVCAKNAKKDKIEQFEQVVKETLLNIVKEGIDSTIINSCINNFEFELKEGDSGTYPKGLLYAISVMESWLYDGSPTLLLKYEDALEKIKKEANNGIFEKVIEDYILNNKHYNFIVLEPVVNLSKEDNEKTKENLKKYKESLSDDEIKEEVNSTLSLLKMQQTPDLKEVTDLIPSINISDIDENPQIINDVEEESLGKNNIYIRTDDTRDITYIDVNYEVGLNDEYEIYLLELLCKCYENFSTNNYDILSLNNEINSNLGDISFNIAPYQNVKNINSFKAFLTVTMKAFNNKEMKMYEIMQELILNTNFRNTEKLKDVLKEEVSKNQSKFMSASHRLVLNEMLATYDRKAMFVKQFTGIPYYKFLTNALNNFEEESEKIIAGFVKLTYRIINSRKDIIITTTKDHKKKSLKTAKGFLECYDSSLSNKIIFNDNESKENLGIILPTAVNYVGQAGNFRKLGYNYEGSMLVLKKYLSTVYLWNNIRVMGGAYGSFITTDKFGNFSLVSYRDPHIKRTLDVYKDLPEYIKNIKLDEKEIKKLIIGTISDMDTPFNVYNKIREYTSRKYTCDTYEDIKRKRLEVLSTNKGDLAKHYDLVNDVLNNSVKCAVSGKEKMESEKEIFTTQISVF